MPHHSRRFSTGAVALAAAVATSLPSTINAADLLFNGATLNSDLTVPPDTWVRVTDGLTLNNATVTFAVAGAGMIFDGDTQTFGGTGQVIVHAKPHSSGYKTVIAGSSLTIGPGITLRTGLRSGDSDGALQIGEVYSTVVNRGTIAAETLGMPLYLRGSWSNQGTIRLSDGVTASLGGTFTPADVGTIDRAGGTVVVDGTINGAGQTLTLDASTGSWLARGARVNGITIRTRDDAQFRVQNGVLPTFTGVTVAGAVTIEPATRLAVRGGLSLNDGGSIALQSYSFSSTSSTELEFYDQQNIGGTGHIVFDGPGDNSRFTVFNGSKITFGPNITIRTGTGGGTISDRGIPDAITILGQVIAAPGGGRITLSGTTLQGTITALPGGHLGLERVQNHGVISVSQATLTLFGPLVGPGQTSIDSSTIELAATFSSAQVRALPQTNSTFSVVAGGIVQNAGDTIALASVAGGKVVGGTLTSPVTGNPVTVTGGTLDAVTLGSDLTVNAGASLTSSTLTVPAGIRLSVRGPLPPGSPLNPTVVSLTGSQGLSGGGTVSFDGDTDFSTIRSLSSVLVIGSGLTVQTGTRGGTLGFSQVPTVNHGIISAQTPGAILTVAGSSLTNNGTMTASNGGVLSLVPRASFPAGGGVIDVDGGFVALDYTGASPANDIRQRLLTGRNGGTWTGPGIRSTAAANDPTGRTAVAYADATSLLGLAGAQTATWHGVRLDATSFVLITTLTGDANLDGTLGPDDYALLDKGLLTGGAYWWQGDFDYDGTVGPADYLLIDSTFLTLNPSLTPAFLQQRESQFGAAYVSDLLTSIPEPSLPAACALALLFRHPQRRRKPIPRCFNLPQLP